MKNNKNYSFFFTFFFLAFIAIIFNILIQSFVFITLGSNSIIVLYTAMISSTFFTLLLKFWLDKKYLFKFNFKTFKNLYKGFSLYSINGLLTTLIFWFIENIFYFLFDNKYMILFGAVIGLSIGYIVKYNLDKKLVFVQKNII